MTRPSASGLRAQVFCLPEPMVAEMWVEARRLGRSLSWVMRFAWQIARGEIARTRAEESAP